MWVFKLEMEGGKMPDSSYYENLSPAEVHKLWENKDIEELIEKLQSAKTWQEKRSILIMLEPLEVSDPIVIQPLVDAVIDIAKKGEHRILRRTAVSFLGEIGGAEVVEPLTVVLLKSPTPDVRRVAAEALAKIEVKIGEVKAVGFLVAVLEDVNEETIVRQGAAEALGKIRNSNAVKPLTFVLEDENEDRDVRKEIVEALGKIATEEEEAVVSLIGALDTSLGEKVSLVLKKVGEPAVMPLISALNSDNQTVREKVITILGETREKRAVEPLLALLVDENEDEDFRGYYVAAALGSIGDARAVKQLIKFASKHAEDQLTCGSVRALGDIGDHRAVDALIAILDDEKTIDCSHLRLETCWALRKLKDPRAIESLIKILENHRKTTYGLEDAAASALVELDDDRIELPLLRYFSGKLDMRIKSKESMQDEQQQQVLEGVSKLLARLIARY